jgi:hypothetical protein
VQKNVIINNSAFFSTIFNKSATWKETAERLVRLPEVDPQTFRIYFDWLHNGDVDLACFASRPMYCVKWHDRKASRKAIRELIHAYALGYVLQDMGFRNAVVDEMWDLMECTRMYPRAADLDLLCSVVPPQTKMMMLMVDAFAARGRPVDFRTDIDCWPRELLTGLVEAALEDRGKDTYHVRWPGSKWIGHYHEHLNEGGWREHISGPRSASDGWAGG